MATANTDTPLWCGKSSINFLPTKTQKIMTGAVIKKMVMSIDRASGPNTSLPPKKNTWREYIIKDK